MTRNLVWPIHVLSQVKCTCGFIQIHFYLTNGSKRQYYYWFFVHSLFWKLLLLVNRSWSLFSSHPSLTVQYNWEYQKLTFHECAYKKSTPDKVINDAASSSCAFALQAQAVFQTGSQEKQSHATLHQSCYLPWSVGLLGT